MDKKFKIFELGQPTTIGNYTNIDVIGLDEIFMSDDSLGSCPVNGAVGLLYASECYPGCCQLFYTYREPTNNGGFSIDFYPAYTKDGELILIKTPTETPLLFFSTKYTDEKNKQGYLSYKSKGWNS